MDIIKKIVILLMIAIFIGIFITCSFILIKNFLEYHEENEINEKLIEETINIPTENNEENKNVAIDWEKLESINSDIIGWIKIDDTNINYPIMQDTDLYYMSHTYEKKYNRNGSIFTKTSNPFKAEETILYGHNNKNGIMFANIDKFMNEDFFNNHRTFKIYTKNAEYDANIFSIYSIEVNQESDNLENLEFSECIEYYKNQSRFKQELEEIPKNIVKLSTCSYLNNKARPTNQRYYLTASLVENK